MKISILTVLLTFVTTFSFSQENNSYKSSLTKLIQVSGSEAAYKGALNQMVSMFKQQQSNVPKEFWDEFTIEVNKDALNQLIGLILPIYQKH
jgi:PDZ domain-containing secreted protein